jgi:hypothetical protein
MQISIVPMGLWLKNQELLLEKHDKCHLPEQDL